MSAAMPMATSLSQNTEQGGGRLGVAHVGRDFAFLCRDAGGAAETRKGESEKQESEREVNKF